MLFTMIFPSYVPRYMENNIWEDSLDFLFFGLDLFFDFDFFEDFFGFNDSCSCFHDYMGIVCMIRCYVVFWRNGTTTPPRKGRR